MIFKKQKDAYKKTSSWSAILTTGVVTFILTAVVFTLELPSRVSEFYYSFVDKPIALEVRNLWQYQSTFEVSHLPDGKPFIKLSGIFQLTNRGSEDIVLTDFQLLFESVMIDDIPHQLRQTSYVADTMGYLVEIYKDERDLIENRVSSKESWQHQLSRRISLPHKLAAGEQSIMVFLMDFGVFVDGVQDNGLQVEEVRRILPDLLDAPTSEGGARRCVLSNRRIKIEAWDRQSQESVVMVGTFHNGCEMQLPSAKQFYGLDKSIPEAPLSSTASLVQVVVPFSPLKLSPDGTGDILPNAKQGDVFKMAAQNEGWVQVVLFSGDMRFIASSAVRETAEAPELQIEEIGNLCHRIRRAQAKAASASAEAYPTEPQNQVVLQRIYEDLHILPLFQEYGIAPARFIELQVRCINELN